MFFGLSMNRILYLTEATSYFYRILREQFAYLSVYKTVNYYLFFFRLIYYYCNRLSATKPILMSFKSFSVLIGIIIFLFSGLITQAQFGIDAELRPRGEAWRGYRVLQPDTLKDPLFYFSQRTRLSFNFNSDVLDIKITAQDVRIWGSDNIYSSTGAFGRTAGLDLYEGWLAVRPFTNLEVKVGRQTMNYDDGRLLSNRNWNQYGLTYDMFLLAYEKDDWKIHGAFSWYNNLYSRFGLGVYPDKIRSFSMLWLSKEFGASTRVTAISLLTGAGSPDANEVVYLKSTTGVNVFVDVSGFNAHLAGYYQAGKHKDGRDVSAYALIGKVGYKKNWFGVSGGINYLSGQNFEKNDPAESNKYQLFDVFYGARHKFYGYMDYFVNIESSTMGGGLNDLFLSFKPKFAEKHSIEVAAHYFALAGKIIDPYINSPDVFLESYLGTEIDLVYEFSPFKFMKLQAGLGWLSPGESLEKIQSIYGTEILEPWFSYVQLIVKPSLFKTKEEIVIKP